MSEERKKELAPTREDMLVGVKAIEDPVGRLLTVKEVGAEIGLSRAMIYRQMSAVENPLPSPIKFGMASRWSIVEIINWKVRARDRSRGGTR